MPSPPWLFIPLLIVLLITAADIFSELFPTLDQALNEMLYLLAEHFLRLLEWAAPRAPRGWVASSAAAERAAGLVYDVYGQSAFLWPGYWEWHHFAQTSGDLYPGAGKWLVRPEGAKEPGLWVNPGELTYTEAMEHIEKTLTAQKDREKAEEIAKKRRKEQALLDRKRADKRRVEMQIAMAEAGEWERQARMPTEWKPTNEKGKWYNPNTGELGILCSDGIVREQLAAYHFEQELYVAKLQAKPANFVPESSPIPSLPLPGKAFGEATKILEPGQAGHYLTKYLPKGGKVQP